MRLLIVFCVLALPIPVVPQTTLYWAGAGHDPVAGGDGGWNTTEANWSNSSASYVPVVWGNGAQYNAVLGGSSSGTMVLDGGFGISGVQLTVNRDYVIDTLGNNLIFQSVAFAGETTQLTLTGGGSLSGQVTVGTLVLSGVTYTLADASSGTIVAKDAALVVGPNHSGPMGGTLAMEFHDTATLRLTGDTRTLRMISSAAPGAGIIENGHGIRAAQLTIEQPSGTVEYSGLIRDNSSGPQATAKLHLRKDGAGTLILSGEPKTYTGGTVIGGGTLQLDSANVLPSDGWVTVGGNEPAILALNGHDQTIGGLDGNLAASSISLGAATLTLGGSGGFYGVISGSGMIVVKPGSTGQHFGGANTYSGGTLVEGGTLSLSHPMGTGSGPVTFLNGTKLNLSGSLTLDKDVIFTSGEVAISTGWGATLSGVLSGSATLDFSAGSIGTSVNLTGENTYSGGTRITNMTVAVAADTALGDVNGSIALNNGALQWLQSFNLSPTRGIALTGSNQFSPMGMVTLSQAITGTGALAVGSSGTLILTGDNTFSGGLFVNGPATVVVGDEGALGASEGAVGLTGGTLRFADSMTLSTGRTLLLSGLGTISVDEGATVSIPVSIGKSGLGSASFHKAGTGTLVLTSTMASGIQTTVLAGTLRLGGGDDRLPVNQPVLLQNGVLDLDGNTQTVSGLSGNGDVELKGGTLVVTGSVGLWGGFAGNGLIRITGSGNHFAYNSEGFSGRLQVEAGTLRIDSLMGSTSTLALSGGTALGGVGTTGMLEMTEQSVLNPGGSYIGSLSARSTWLEGAVRYRWQVGDAPGGSDLVADNLLVQGVLHLQASAVEPLVIEVESLNEFGGAGTITGFSPALNRRFPLVATTAGISGFEPDVVALDLAGFQNSYSGFFRVELGNAGLDLELAYYATAFQRWLADHFSPAEQADASISGPDADPDGDGYSNLIEYALGLEPKSPSTTGLPEMGTTATDWVYTYTRPSDRADLTYAVEVSTDLGTWTSVGVVHEFVAPAGAGSEVWQAKYPLASAANVFFRLCATGQ